MRLDKNFFDREYLKLYAVTDGKYETALVSLEQQVEKSILGGVTCVQIREKNLCRAEFLDRAYKIKDVCNKHNIPFIVNDSIEIALKCGADGVHIGQNDMDIKEVRKLMGNKPIIGVSVQTLEQAVDAELNGASYLGVGSIFSTYSKDDAEIVSIETLSDICKNANIPVVAIGGINKSNLGHLYNLGVSGVAFISAIFENDNITKECEKLNELLDKL